MDFAVAAIVKIFWYNHFCTFTFSIHNNVFIFISIYIHQIENIKHKRWLKDWQWITSESEKNERRSGDTTRVDEYQQKKSSINNHIFPRNKPTISEIRFIISSLSFWRPNVMNWTSSFWYEHQIVGYICYSTNRENYLLYFILCYI